ncbi:hypothetical protein NHX12_005602 [Muraenolepis orangiensis]|uniref:L1 transposable element RRM domain-containing protein n=1 Tax=Muraenolepis orangiensis TaxID=630683 RepID=A0A9Q0DVC0_9TELE|nr:hypothetical protein NHX12_005602 [Muraenolepis orangiensis]
MKGRLTTAESRISDTEDITAQLSATITELETKVQSLAEKNEDLENLSRRSNVQLIGLPENAEGTDAETFLEKWLPEVHGAEHFPTPVMIERAHRIGPANSTSPAQFPRPLVIKFLNFRDKVRVTKATGIKDKVMSVNRQVRLNQMLQSRGIQYGLQFPAKLCITYGGKPITFQTSQDASPAPTGAGGN